MSMSVARLGLAALAVALASLLGSCASLPREQAASFATIAHASSTSLDTLLTTANQATSDLYLDHIAAGDMVLRIQGSGCSGSEGDCDLAVADNGAAPGTETSLTSSVPHLQAVLRGVGSYADAMSELSTADDLTAVNAATGKAIAGLKQIATDVGASAVVGPALDVLGFTLRELRVAERRHVLTRIATQGQPVIDEAARQLGTASTQLRGILIQTRQLRLRALLDRYSQDQSDRQTDAARGTHTSMSTADRRTLLTNIIAAAASLRQARAIPTDFAALSQAHQAVLTALQNPRADVTLSSQRAAEFATLVSVLAAAANPPAGTTH
jgi:hypothetical protein